MFNNDLTHNCPDELLLWIDNDPYFAQEWRKSVRTGNITYIKDALEIAGFKYREDQYERLVDQFEEELVEDKIYTDWQMEHCNRH